MDWRAGVRNQLYKLSRRIAHAKPAKYAKVRTLPFFMNVSNLCVLCALCERNETHAKLAKYAKVRTLPECIKSLRSLRPLREKEFHAKLAKYAKEKPIPFL